ncbi:zinc finger protein 2 homolog [Gouania willdenowi]|uniref:zinc finger protein 2 homolog n=1 Tax=Gouania willdenowi TaxID=441366 RepID=UPI0010547AAF|nr:zinc finger protein 2 homolog [Gouania willdenowi]
MLQERHVNVDKREEMEQHKAPPPLSLIGNLADNWCTWEQSFRLYIVSSGEKDEKLKIDILLHTIGEDALEVFKTLKVTTDGDELTMEDVLQAFRDYCSPRKNVVFERYQFWSYQTTAGTSVNGFITELRQKITDCEFGIIEHDMLRDKFVLSITDSDLKKRLLQERGLTLNRAIEICRATEQEKTLLQAMETEHGVQEVPVDAEMKMILPDKSLHHNTSKQLGSKSVQNMDETEKLVLAAFMPKVHLHRLKLQQSSVTDSVFSDRKNMEQLLTECLHIKQEPETLSEGQEGNQLCVEQETNTAASPVKCEDEEENPQASQLHWRQLTEVNKKEEKPSTCSLNEFINRQTVGINNKGPEAAQNLDPSSLVLQGPDGTTTDSSQTEDSDDGDDEDSDLWQKPLSDSETEAKAEFDSTRKKRKMSDSSINAEMGCKAPKTRISSFKQICTKKKVQVKMTSEYVGGKKSPLSAASKLTIHKGEKPFKCDICRKCFKRKGNLQVHMRIHTGEKPFKCDVCSKCFTHKHSLQVHMNLHLGEKPFKCDVCNQCFTHKHSLQVHMNLHLREKPFKCDVCSNCYHSRSNLQSHMRIHTGEKPFKCDVCSKCFTRKDSLQLHINLHTGEKPFKCDVCHECFIAKGNLQSHMRIHTGEKPFKCDVCNKCFIAKGNLQSHMRIHTGEKPFKCDVCSKCFTWAANLQSHRRIHTGEKPFKCDVCSKCYRSRSNLQSHMRIHTGDKPFKCDVCSKCFIVKGNLQSHMRIHTGEKPFKCEVCSKSFNQKVSLQVHMRVHSGEKPFKCDFCSKIFKHNRNLQSHVRIHKREKPLK